MSNAPLVKRMLNAAMDRSDETLRAAVDSMLEHGIPAEVIVDEIIPKTARTMGEEWVQDISSFASVTLGASRLQTLVRELAAKWSADDEAGLQTAVLLWVPQKAQHTLGATVVSTQLRRRGHSVQFSPGGGLPELAHALTEGTYDGVIISASMSDSPDDVRDLVGVVKAHHSRLPVIVGGTLLKQHSNLTHTTGVDFATNDLDKATAAFLAAR